MCPTTGWAVLAPRPSGGLLPAQIGEPFFETVGIVAARLEEVRQRSLGCPADFREINVKQLAIPLAESSTCSRFSTGEGAPGIPGNWPPSSSTRTTAVRASRWRRRSCRALPDAPPPPKLRDRVRGWDLEFESGLLQRGVMCEPGSANDGEVEQFARGRVSRPDVGMPCTTRSAANTPPHR